MKLRRNKKGFTMIELIIVIAVIAVLTAILVPTFIHLASKAGDASDKTIVKNANTQLALKAAQGRRNTSMSEAVKDVDEIGYHMSGVSTSNGNQICWDRLNDRFVLFNKDNQIILADGDRTQPTEEELVDFFKPVSNFADAGKFTPYAKSDFDFGDSGVSLTNGTLALGAKSLDVGELEGVTTVNVEHASATGTYFVGTGNTSVTVNVNVPNGTVYHLGIAREVNITGIAGDSYHEFGRIGFAEMASSGRYVAEKGAEVKALWFSNENAKYTKESGATVNEYAPSTAIKSAIEAQLTNDDVILSDDEHKNGVKDGAIEAITEEINKEEGIVDQAIEVTQSNYRTVFVPGKTNYILTEDIVGTTVNFVIPEGCTVNLDLNGHSITCAFNEAIMDVAYAANPDDGFLESVSSFVNYGTTNIIGTGTIGGPGGWFGLFNKEGATITLDGCTIRGGTVYMAEVGIPVSFGAVRNDGTLNAEGYVYSGPSNSVFSRP